MRTSTWLIPVLLSTYSLSLRSETITDLRSGDYALEVRQTVSGIISFTQWPKLNGLPRLCVFNSAEFAPVLKSAAVEYPPAVWQTIPVNDIEQALSARCDILYFGRESNQQQTEVINRYRPRPLLTIAEQTPGCEAGSAFCIRIINSQVKFSVNLDSLSRSGVRVNPEVLMLASSRTK